MDPMEIQRTLIAFVLAGGQLPFERILFDEDKGTGGGGGGGGGEGGNTQQGPPAAEQPKYSDKQVNDLIAKERRSLEAKLKAEHEAAIKAAREEAEVAKNEAALAGKSAEEKAKLIAESEAKKRAAEADRVAKEASEYKTRAERAEAQLRHRVVSSHAQSALVEAKVLPAMAGDALDLFMLKAQVELEDDGATVKSVTLDGAYHKTMKEAAEAFLKTRPGFVPAPAGGSGTPRGGAPSLGGRKLSELQPVDLMALAEERDRSGR